MLVLSRYAGQTIQIDGGIEIEVLKISGNQVRLGIRAPRETLVLRGELEKLETLAEKQETSNGGELVDGQPIWVLLGDNWIPRHFARHGQWGGVYCYWDGKSKHGAGRDSKVTHWQVFRTTDPALDGASQ